MNAWLTQVFSAGQVAKGNIVRRKKSTVEKQSSMKDLIRAVKKKKFHLIETGDQVIVVCNTGTVKLVC
jgi:hypothetical protein